MSTRADAAEFRKALGSFATGVTIVTTCREGARFGVTANSFNSVSLDPPLVLWSLSRTSSSLDAFSDGAGFAVHILADDQQSLSDRFAKRGVDKFEGLSIETGINSVPLLPDCAARFECRTVYQYEGGDHIIFVGEVLNFTHAEKQPLLFHGGRYAKATAAEAAAEEAEIENDIHANDLSYLLARTYFQLLTPVRRRAAGAGLGLSEHYALSILMLQGECSLQLINEIIEYTGVTVGSGSVDRLSSLGLASVRGGDSSDPRLTLTPAGRQLMIELAAAAKSVEADAQLYLDQQEARLLKRLLHRFLKGLEQQGDVDHVSRHMNLMRQAVHGESKDG